MTDSDLGRSYPAPNFGRTAATPNLGRSYPAPNLGREYPAPNLGRETTVAPAAIVYLLGPFQFTQDQVAPLPSPYTEGGAVGSLTVVDTESKASISGGKLQFAGGKAVPVNYGDPGVFGVNSFTRTIGRTFFADFLYTAGTAGTILGWSNVATSTPSTAGNFRVGVSLLETRSTGAALTFTNPVISTVYQLAVVLRSSGNFYFIKGGIYTNWTLLWVEAATTTTPLYAAVANFDNVGTVDNLRVIDLGTYDARFATDFGLATNRLVSPIAGATTTSTADSVIEWNVTGNGVAIPKLRIRKTDVNNYWEVVPNANGFLLLNEMAAGVNTQRGAVGAAVNNAGANRLMVVAEGAVIKVYNNNVLYITYSSATLNQTATGIEVNAIGASTADVVCWPRTLSLPAGI